jgi:CheY-like chemotaxis protein
VEVLSKLFNSLLDVTLLDTRQLVPKALAFNLGALIEDISDEFRLAAEAENVVLKPKREDVFINSDALIVRRILQNLVSNAIRHTDGGAVELSAHQNEDGVFLVVKDTGRGISEIDQAQIFEEFTKAGTVTDAAEGLGLGLAIVRRLSQVLNVIINFSSQEGEGTQFSIGPFVPADDPGEVVKTPPPHFVEAIGRVLVIDDDKATLEATAALLSNWGWDINARTHLSAQDIAKLSQPDLIISDYDLGFGRTGLDTISEICSLHGDIPALLITGSSNAGVRRKIIQAGYVVLHKPVRPVQLRSAILGALG